MSTITAPAATYRKTKTGEWVAYGPAAALKIGGTYVAKKSGEVKYETITRLGRPFTVDGVEMVYGYLHKDTQPQARYEGGGRRGCKTGGNCSSFGSGRSCGAHDCDGY